jgi:hypothetical protein
MQLPNVNEGWRIHSNRRTQSREPIQGTTEGSYGSGMLEFGTGTANGSPRTEENSRDCS